MADNFTVSYNGQDFFGTFESLEAATQTAQTESKHYGYTRFWIGVPKPPTQPERMWHVDDWLEHVSCSDDYSGEWAEGWERSTKEQREELEDTVRAMMSHWLDKHKLRPTHFTVEEISEYVIKDGAIRCGGTQETA